MSNKAILCLEDGFCLEGRTFTVKGQAIGEVVFNTSMSGYQEILTDPSYRGQMVCMNYPLMGNYGITKEDFESDNIQVKGLIVKEDSLMYSNYQAGQSLREYLVENNVLAIEGVDTRALVRHIRTNGAMKAIITTEEFDKRKLKSKLDNFPSISDIDLVSEVATKKIYEWPRKNKTFNGLTVAVVDCGVKLSILRHLKEHFSRVLVFPYTSSLKNILAFSPAAILFSNGPGDPRLVKPAISLAQEVLETLRSKTLKAAVMGICLGHQILGIALGAKILKLKFGHHGGNHPVKELSSGHIDITAQNHNFIIDPDSVKDKNLVQTHINLYDNTSEGMRHRKMPFFSLQFHPESCPGPFDAAYIFKQFKKEAERIC